MTRWLAMFVMVGLVLGLGAPAIHADDSALGARVASVIERVRKEVERQLMKAAKAAREGKLEDALRLVEQAVSSGRAGVNAAYNTAGKPPPKLPPKESPPPSAGATPTPAVPLPTPSAPTAPPSMVENYDRFTGEARVSLGGIRVAAAHKDTRARAMILIQYDSWRSENGQVQHALFFGSDDAAWGPSGLLAKGQAVTAYFLVDGRRARAQLPMSPMSHRNLDGNPLQQVVFMLDPGWRESLLGARKFEMRLGEHDFEIPATYRAAAKAANERLTALTK